MNEIIFLKGNESSLPSKELRNKTTFYITEDSGKIILGDNTWDSKNTKYVQLTSGETNTHYVLYFNNVEVFKVPILKYDVKIEIIGCKVSKYPNTVKLGDSLIINVTNKEKNIIEELVQVGGVDKTAESFDGSKITLNNINGNVYIVLKYNKSIA